MKLLSVEERLEHDWSKQSNEANVHERAKAQLSVNSPHMQKREHLIWDTYQKDWSFTHFWKVYVCLCFYKLIKWEVHVKFSLYTETNTLLYGLWTKNIYMCVCTHVYMHACMYICILCLNSKIVVDLKGCMVFTF